MKPKSRKLGRVEITNEWDVFSGSDILLEHTVHSNRVSWVVVFRAVNVGSLGN